MRYSFEGKEKRKKKKTALVVWGREKKNGFRSSISPRSVDLLVAQDPLLLADPRTASSLLFFCRLQHRWEMLLHQLLACIKGTRRPVCSPWRDTPRMLQFSSIRSFIHSFLFFAFRRSTPSVLLIIVVRAAWMIEVLHTRLTSRDAIMADGCEFISLLFGFNHHHRQTKPPSHTIV
jgi:hypothetical protein